MNEEKLSVGSKAAAEEIAERLDAAFKDALKRKAVFNRIEESSVGFFTAIIDRHKSKAERHAEEMLKALEPFATKYNVAKEACLKGYQVTDIRYEHIRRAAEVVKKVRGDK